MSYWLLYRRGFYYQRFLWIYSDAKSTIGPLPKKKERKMTDISRILACLGFERGEGRALFFFCTLLLFGGESVRVRVNSGDCNFVHARVPIGVMDGYEDYANVE